MENIENQEEIIKYPEIAQELRVRRDKDQEMRERSMQNGGIIETEEDDMVDIENTNRMKEIVNEIGWPTISKVGKEGSFDAWLLVQHADHDVEFQMQCLDLMKAEPEGEVNPVNIAYLEDRTRVNNGEPQIYGTQFYEHQGYYGPRPIEDQEHVDERREALGLEPMQEYERSLRIRRYNIGKDE